MSTNATSSFMPISAVTKGDSDTGSNEITPSPSTNNLQLPAAQPTLNRKLSVPRKNVFAVADELLKCLRHLFLRTPNARYYDRFIKSFDTLLKDCAELEPVVYSVQKIADKYDLDEKTPGNGYRSLVCLVDTALLHLIGLLRIVDQRCSNITFRTSCYCKEIEAYAGIMKFLATTFRCIDKMRALEPGNNLFYMDEISEPLEKLMTEIESQDITCFYGRAIGFHFCASVTKVFNVIGVALATYSCHWQSGGPISSALTAGRFWLSPETCAKQIVTTTQKADIAFCKAFWNLTEMGIMTKMPDLFCPVLLINDMMEIAAEYDQHMEGLDGQLVKIAPPSSHTGQRSIGARYLSASARQGIEMKRKAKEVKNASRYLVFNCHGGGFVATTSKSHETYLRVWAKMLDCPILSVDYSLAPENPYPRAIEEALYAYAWALNHREKLGWTGEKVCFVGDSAGGNLLVAVTLRLIELGVKRLPDALVPIYTPFMFRYAPSPSRVFSYLDPLLPTGIVLRCVAAYTGHSDLINKAHMVASPTFERKSLQEYFMEAQRQRAQYEKVDVGESNDIVNVVNGNNRHADNKKKPAKKTDMFSLGPSSDEEDEAYLDAGERTPPVLDNDRRRSQTDSASKGTPTLAQELEETMPQVAVHRKDGDRIWMTTSIHTDDLVDFLSEHPITKDDVLIVHTPNPVGNTALTQNDKTPLAASPSVHSIANNISSSYPYDNEHKPLERTQDPPMRKASAVVSVNTCSDAVRKNSQAIRKDSGEMIRVRTWSNSFSDVVALATGHASDVAAGIIERTSVIPVAEDESMLRLKKLAVPKDPLISPLYASDQMLAKFPPCYMVGCHMDPLLDDCIEFAKRLRKVGAKVNVDLLDSLPHGFLNFTLMSAECREGAKVCVENIQTALKMSSATPNNTTPPPSPTDPNKKKLVKT